MSDLTALLQHLRQAGHRMTPQREMILSAICKSGGHLTADDILTRVHRHYPYIGKSAVYRTLDLLCRLDLVTQTDLGRGRIEYEIHEHPHHHHLLCRRCGKRVQVDAHVFSALDELLRQEYGFAPDLDHFAIFGVCHKCNPKGAAKRKQDNAVSR